MIHQMPRDLKNRLYMDELRILAYLNGNPMSGETLPQNFASLDAALSGIGYSYLSKTIVYQFMAAILHLGEISFDDINEGSCDVKESSKDSLGFAAKLLNIDENKLKDALLSRYIVSTKET